MFKSVQLDIYFQFGIQCLYSCENFTIVLYTHFWRSFAFFSFPSFFLLELAVLLDNGAGNEEVLQEYFL